MPTGLAAFAAMVLANAAAASHGLSRLVVNIMSSFSPRLDSAGLPAASLCRRAVSQKSDDPPLL
jgi:hypothetical protein